MPRSTPRKILVIGDAMLDEYLAGEITRMSPEVPTAPVLAVSAREARLGGAANVAHNVVKLGGKATLLGLRGDDAAGAEIARMLKSERIGDALLVTDRPTTLKTRLLASEVQKMRVDIEVAAPLKPAVRAKLIAAIKKSDADLCIVSDYAKGVLSKEVAQALLKRFGPDGVIGDVKPVNAKLVRGFRVVTPNRHEAIAMLGGENRADRDLALALKKKLGSGVAITLGEHGSIICDAEYREPEEIAPYPVASRDVTGAGDTFTAALALGLAAGEDLAAAAKEANIAAALAVSRAGTVAVTRDDVARA